MWESCNHLITFLPLSTLVVVTLSVPNSIWLVIVALFCSRQKVSSVWRRKCGFKVCPCYNEPEVNEQETEQEWGRPLGTRDGFGAGSPEKGKWLGSPEGWAGRGAACGLAKRRPACAPKGKHECATSRSLHQQIEFVMRHPWAFPSHRWSACHLCEPLSTSVLSCLLLVQMD